MTTRTRSDGLYHDALGYLDLFPPSPMYLVQRVTEQKMTKTHFGGLILCKTNGTTMYGNIQQRGNRQNKA